MVYRQPYNVMKTSIKSVRPEMFAGEFTGKVIVSVADAMKGVERNVDADGVITFAVVDTCTSLRMQSVALSAQVRNEVDATLQSAVNYRLDAAKATGFNELISVLNVMLAGASVDVECEIKEAEAAEDGEEAHTVVFYKMKNLELSNMAKFVVAQFFVNNFMKIEDVNQQMAMVKAMFGISL